MAILTAEHRDNLKAKTFAIPKGRKYPIHDETHARNALARVRQHGTPEERNQVYSAVAKKYPGLAERSSIKNVQRRVKTAAPIALIRKLAAEEGATAKERIKSLDKKMVPLQVAHAGGLALPALAGGVGGAALGGVLGARHLGDGIGPGYVGGALGLLGGMAAGELLPGNRERAAQIKDLQAQRTGLAGMQPDATGELSDETLDRDRYHQARAESAKHTLALMDAGKPLRKGMALGALGGGALGAALTPSREVLDFREARRGSLGRVMEPFYKKVAPNISDRIGGGTIGAGLGLLAGTGLGIAAMGHKGRKDSAKAMKGLGKAQENKSDVWRAAAGMEDAPVEEVRKAASAVAFRMLTEDPEVSSGLYIIQTKMASAEDPELLQESLDLCRDLDRSIALYEAMGGTYKHAFGMQMFDTKQMAGSPALAGGVRQRSMTQPVAPQAAPAAPTSTSNSGQPKSQATSAPSMTSAQSGSSGASGTPAGTTTITI